MYFIGIYYASFWRAMLIPLKLLVQNIPRGMVDFQKPVPSIPIKIDNIFKINTENNFSNKLGTTNNRSLV